jgi:tetratricopeptide (TPR) repeat protein
MRGPVVLVLVVTGLSAGAKPQPAIYEQQFKEGVRLQQEARYAEAGAAYTTALEQAQKQLGPEHTDVAQILINLGTVRTLMHDDIGALAAFEQAIVTETPEVLNTEIRAGLGDYAQMLRKMKRRQEARQIDRQLKSLLPR